MPDLNAKIVRFTAMEPSERRIVLQSVGLLPLCSLALRMFGLARTLRRIHGLAGTAAGAALSIERIRQIGYAVNAAAHHGPFRATCLTRSVLLAWLLRRRGAEATVRVGVKLTSGQLAAHAWVECAGVPVNDRPDIATEFSPFDEAATLAAFRS